jgi:hypothetical protein
MKLTAEQIQEAYANATKDTDILRLLRMPSCPDDVLTEELSRNIALTIEQIPRIMKPDAYSCIRAAGRHPNLSSETISKYVNWGAVNVSDISKVSDILKNPNMAEDHFRALLTHRYASRHVLRYIADHPNCPEDIVFDAATCNYPDARVAVANNPKLSTRLMGQLINDNDWNVRVNLIRNKSVPINMLKTIIEDPSYGRHHGKKSVRVFQALVNRMPRGADRQKALNILVSFSDNQRSKILMARLTQESNIAHEYCFDPDPVVRATASQNPVTPEEGRIAVALLEFQVA